MRGKNKKEAIEHLKTVYREAEEIMNFELLDQNVKEKFDHNLSLLKASDYQKFIDVNAEYKERLEREIAYAHKGARKAYLSMVDSKNADLTEDLIALGFSNPKAKIDDFREDYTTIMDLVDECTQK